MRLTYIFAAALLALVAVTAQAATPAPAGASAARPGEHGHWCADNAKECKDQAAKFDQWCSANADKCTALKAEAQRHIEYCSQHKKECEEHHEHKREHFKGWCDKNPNKPACKNQPANTGDQPPPG